MSDLKKQLIRLGSSHPDLQKDLVPVLDFLSKEAYSNGDYGDQSKNRSFYPDSKEEVSKEASTETLQEVLLRMGSDSPELQKDIAPVLDHLTKVI